MIAMLAHSIHSNHPGQAETAYANAALIAAAPDLLAALEKIARHWKTIDDDEDAIFSIHPEHYSAWREAGAIAEAAIRKAKS